MIKRGKSGKKKFKLKVKNITPKEISPEKRESLIEITEKGDDINNQKFIEFLTPSTEPIKTLESEKPRSVRPIEQNEEVLSFIPKEKDKDEKVDYSLQTSSKDYEPFSPREEKKQDITTTTFVPQRVNFHEVGRDTRMPLREIFTPLDERNQMASPKRDEVEKNYDIERVDFTEIGREKRYKLMK